MGKCQFEAAIKEMKTFVQERMKGKFVSKENKDVLQAKLDEIAKMELMVRKLQGTVRVTNVSEVVVSKPTVIKPAARKDFRSEFKEKRPSAAKWVDKEGAKFDVATQAISDGTKDSTAGFVKDYYGDKANTGTYAKDDVVYLSTNGKRTGRIVPVKKGVLQGAYKNIDKAIEAGAKFVADTGKHLASTGKYNVGEVELAEYLQSKGYVREDKAGYGLWSPGKASAQTTKVSKPITADELKIEKVLSSDIDAVETTEDATKEWISKRIDTLGLPEEVVESMKNNMNRLNGLLYNGTKERTSEIEKKHGKLNQLLLNKLLTDEEKRLVDAMDDLYTLNGSLEAAVMYYRVDTSYRDMIIKYLNLIKDVYGYPEALKLKPLLKDSITYKKNQDYLNSYASNNNKVFQDKFKYKEFLFTKRGHLTYVINDIANVLDQSFTKSFTQLKKTDYDKQAKFLNLFINAINDAYNNNDKLSSAKEVATNKLKIVNDTITDKDGKASIQVNSMEELRGLSEEFNKLMKELGKGPETVTDKIYQDGFEMLEKAGIEFRPFKLTFKKELSGGGYGVHNTKSGNIDVATGVTYNRNPQGVLLHEYAHRISSEKLDKFPVLREKIRELMEHARKNGVTGYGMTDRYEFIAETISNPKFQEQLSKIPSYEGKGIVETVKKVFSKLLERVTGKEASALTDGLDLIVRLAKAEVDEEVSTNLSKDVNEDAKSDYKLKPGKSVVEQVLNEFDKFIDEDKFEELDNKPEGQMTDADWDEHVRLDTLIGRREDIEELVKTGMLGGIAKKDLIKHLGDAWDEFAEYAKIAWGVYHSVGDTATKEQIEKVENISKEVNDSRVAGKDSYTLPGGMKTNKGQTEAINKLKKWYAGKDLTFLLKGRGGTGKTTVIGKAVKELGLRDNDVVYAAYMNKAVGVIEAANKRNGNKESSYVTTAQILGLKPKFNEHTGVTTFVPDDKASDPLVYKKLLVIDEVSMLPNGQQKQIEQRAKSMGIRIIYMGDDVQLPPGNEVIGGVVTKTAKVFEEHIGKENFSELAERMRQGEESPILPVTDALAEAVIKGKSFVEANLGFKTVYDKSKDEGVVFTDRWDNDVLEAFVNDYRVDPKGTRFIHYNTFDNINTLNKIDAIRSVLFKDKAQGIENRFLVGEQITFNNGYYKRDNTGDVKYKADNSTEATVTGVRYESNYGVDYFHGKQERTAFMPVYVVDAIDNFTGEKYDEIIIPAMTSKELKAYREALKTKYGVYQGGLDGELATVGHAYVITSHKSQGSTYSTVYADLGNIASMPIDEDLKLKSAYVATSRASKKLVVLDPRASKSSIPRSKVALKEKDDKIKADQQYRKLLNGMKDC